MIYDITQPLLECEVYPGDPKPEKRTVKSIENGDVCNLSTISLCVHNGTHVDAPLHFLKDGKGINQVQTEKFIGVCYVTAHDGDVTKKDAEMILERARKSHSGAEKKILIRGKATVTLEAAEVFVKAGVELVGNESQTVGPEDGPMKVHLVLLGAEVVLLEGIRLAEVPDGVYFLNCAPLNLTDTDGAPCRAILIDFMKKTNYFVEGIQGSGKTTTATKLLEENPGYKLYSEGDYSPVELAWCAMVDEGEYAAILDRYPTLTDEILKKTVEEGDKKIILYTRILTDVPGFHKELEQYEIYNGNKPRREFEEIVLKRFSGWHGTCGIFECSIFQNIIENMILYFEMSDDEIVLFYRKVKEALSGKEYEIVYLDVDDIRAAEEIIKKERSDGDGVELWFPLMISYLESSPYGVRHGLKGMDGLVEHLQHRVRLEKRILSEVFDGHYRVILRIV